MLEKIKQEIKDLPENFIILTIVPSSQFEKVNMSILDLLVNEMNKKGSYVAINRPYKNMVELLNRNKINASNMFFIDCITKSAGGKVTDIDNCIFLRSPSDITQLSIALETVISQQKCDFIFLDSLNILSHYHSLNVIVQFAHLVTSKIRLHNLKGVIIGLHEETDERLIAEMGQFCDRVIDLTK